MTLSRGVSVRVRILSPDNQPISGAKIQLLDRDGKQVNETGGIAAAFARFFDEDGAMQVGTFAPGSYTLRITWNDDVRTAPVSLMEGQPELVEIKF